MQINVIVQQNTQNTMNCKMGANNIKILEPRKNKHNISIKWGSNGEKNKHIEAGLKIHYAYIKKGVMIMY